MHLANIAVINLARRYERLREFMVRASPHLLKYRDVPVTAWAGVDLPDNPDEGCLQSHLLVLRNVPGPVLVLEDDACFAPDFTLDLTPPPDWDILWLGGQHRLAPLPHDEVWVRPTYLVRTHAYIARDPAMVAVLLRGAPRMDPYLASLRLRQYVLRKHTVGQAAGRSDISGEIRPVDEYWQLQYHIRFNGSKG